MLVSPGVLVLNGPNLNLLGQREPEIYGATTLAGIEANLRRKFPKLELRFEQHNDEGGIIQALHRADTVDTAGIVLNAAGYTHTSVVIRDAIAAIRTPVIEVHLSNVFAREAFRHHSLLSAVCAGTITGLGPAVYALAVRHFAGDAGI